MGCASFLAVPPALCPFWPSAMPLRARGELWVPRRPLRADPEAPLAPIEPKLSEPVDPILKAGPAASG